MFGLKRKAITLVLSAAFLSTQALAEATVEASSTEALKICGVALMQPDQFAKSWLEAGFKLGPAQSISPNWTLTGYTRESANIAITELKFSDVTTVTCQYTNTTSPVSPQDVKNLIAKISNDTVLGPFEVEVGEIPFGSGSKMTMGAMRRPNKVPVIGGTLNMRENFFMIAFSLTKAN